MKGIVRYHQDVEPIQLGGGTERRILAYDSPLMAVEVSFETGSEGAPHTHPHTQMSYVLSGSLGAVGACLAICVAYFVRTVGMCVFYIRYLGFKPVRFIRDTYADWLLPAVITMVIGLIISQVLPIAGWLGFGIEAVIEILVYCASCWAFTLNTFEKEQLVRLLGKLRRNER